MAKIIRTNLRAHILIPSEINGVPNQTNSVEMDRLVATLGVLAVSFDAGWRVAYLSRSRALESGPMGAIRLSAGPGS